MLTSLAGIALLIQALCAGAAHAEPAPAGQALYERRCASCHGKDGRGNPVKAKALKLEPRLLDLGRPESADLDRAALRRILLEGKGRMPAYGKKLAPAEVDPVLDYALGLAAAARGR